jgi:hypothetical protein
MGLGAVGLIHNPGWVRGKAVKKTVRRNVGDPCCTQGRNPTNRSRCNISLELVVGPIVLVFVSAVKHGGSFKQHIKTPNTVINNKNATITSFCQERLKR